MFFLKNDDYFKLRKNIVKYEKEFNKIDSQEIFNKLDNAFIDYLSYVNYLLFENKITGFNNYGTLIAETTTTDVNKISLNSNRIMASYENELEFFDARLNTLGRLKKPENPAEDIFLSGEKLYIYTKSTLYIYQLNIPIK